MREKGIFHISSLRELYDLVSGVNSANVRSSPSVSCLYFLAKFNGYKLCTDVMLYLINRAFVCAVFSTHAIWRSAFFCNTNRWFRFVNVVVPQTRQ